MHMDMTARDGMGVRDAGRSPWREGARVPWLAAALAIAPIVAICVLLPPFYAMNPDDQVQALFASGRFLNADAGLMMPYTLANSAWTWSSGFMA